MGTAAPPAPHLPRPSRRRPCQTGPGGLDRFQPSPLAGAGSLDALSNQRQDAHAFEIELREGRGEKLDAIGDGELLVHHDERTAVHPAEAPPSLEHPGSERLRPDVDTQPRREGLELAKDARLRQGHGRIILAPEDGPAA